MLEANTNTKFNYICGSTNEDRFKEMRRIVFQNTHETPKFMKRKLNNGKIWNGISVLLSLKEQEIVRREINWIGVPQNLRNVL